MRWILVLVIALGMLCASATAAENRWQKNYSVTGKPKVTVQVGDASIHVSTWPRAEVGFVVTTVGWKIGDQVRIEEHQTGNLVSLIVRMGSTQMSIFGGNRSATVEVTVPAQADLDLNTGDGSIRAEGVTGDIRLHTGDGSIEANGVDGNLYATTGDGHLRLRGRFDELTLRTGDGSVDAEILNGSKLATSWSITTGDGGVHVRLPVDLKADLEARTGDGRLDVDVPMQVKSSVNKKQIRGTLNGGGLSFDIRTGDGSIHLSKL